VNDCSERNDLTHAHNSVKNLGVYLRSAEESSIKE